MTQLKCRDGSISVGFTASLICPLFGASRTNVQRRPRSPTCQWTNVQRRPRSPTCQCTKSLRDSDASGLSESTFASAKDLNDEPPVIADAVIILTGSSKQVRLDIVELCGSRQRSVHPMMPDARREGHRARVAECAISATHNSLKSQRAGGKPQIPI